jgi:hypothetical protein
MALLNELSALESQANETDFKTKPDCPGALFLFCPRKTTLTHP